MRISALLLLLFISLPFSAQTSSRKRTVKHAAIESQKRVMTIDRGWQFREVGNSDIAGAKQWHDAQVPGVVQTDLMRHKIIPDPFYRDNEAKVQWVGRTDWEYQTTFNVDPATLARENVDLVFAGLDTLAEVTLNGQKLLNADNMFRRWRVPAKQLLKPGANTLNVVLRSPITSLLPKIKALPYQLPTVNQIQIIAEEGVPTDPYIRKAPYTFGWDWGPRLVTIGIWKPVTIEAWDNARIDSMNIRQDSVSAENANLTALVDVFAAKAGDVTVVVTHDGAGSKSIVSPNRRTIRLEPGTTRVEVPLAIAKPKRWYPVGYGQQPLYGFTAILQTNGTQLDSAQKRTGLRSAVLEMKPDRWGKSFKFVINGIPVFAKGANTIPWDSFPTRVTPEWHRQILQAAVDANMNMVRVWGGGYYESDDFYDICDELGIMIWHDFMFGGAQVPGDQPYLDNVRIEAVEQVKRLNDHPSIVLWCGNNELEGAWLQWGDRLAFKNKLTPQQRERVYADYMLIFHNTLPLVVQQYGAPTPYWPSSPSANFEDVPGSEKIGDMHYWAVWHALNPLEDYAKQFPRFMSEFGFQSFPEWRTIEAFTVPEDRGISTDVMHVHQKNVGGNERIRTYMLRDYKEPKDFASFLYVSQLLQAEGIKLGAEHLRRQRPRTMGSLYWQLNDCWPVASWASVDYYGRWKALHYYAKRFYNDLLASPWEEEGKLNIYVVSDRLGKTPGQLRVRVIDFAGKVLFDRTQAVDITPLSSAVYFSVPRAELLAGGDSKNAVVVTELIENGYAVSRNQFYFEKMKDSNLPSPKLTTELRGENGEYTLRITTDHFARGVYANFSNSDATFSDNYFDLLPGEMCQLNIRSKASLEELKAQLKVMTLVDTY